MIYTTILSSHSKNKVATTKIFQPIMCLWNGHRRCHYAKLLDYLHPNEILWQNGKTQTGMTVMPAVKRAGSTSVNVYVWMSLRLLGCLDQPACWPLSPGWERQTVTPMQVAFPSWRPGFCPPAYQLSFGVLFVWAVPDLNLEDIAW